MLGIGVVALTIAACGGDDDGSPSGSSTQPPSAAAGVATPSAAQPAAPPRAVFDGAARYQGSAAFDWQVQRVDGGTKPGIAITSDGTPVVAYMLERRGAAGFVRVASLTDGGLQVETLQDGYLYGPLDIVAGPGGTIAVGYHNHDNEDAEVAVLDGGEWRIDRIADGGHDGWDTSLAFAADGSLHLLGIDPAQFGSVDGVEYATLRGGAWTVEAVGSGPQPYEWGTDIAVGPDGTVHAVYFDASNRDLVYARNDGSGWTTEPIYENGDAGRFAVIALDEEGRPHVAFVQGDATFREEGRNSGSVVYGAFDGSAWAFESVATLDDMVFGFEGARRTVALALSPGGPVVAFIDVSQLGLATLRDGAWGVETVLAAGDDPFQVVGLALDGDGAPFLTFSTITGNGPLDGEIWLVAPVAKGAG
ncbi:MAG: hypothetical protein V3S31_01155 [Dehalococcoidia bacterium]